MTSVRDSRSPVGNVGVHEDRREDGVDGSHVRVVPSILDRLRGALRGFRLGDSQLQLKAQPAEPRPLTALFCEFKQDGGGHEMKRVDRAGEVFIPEAKVSFDGHRYTFRLPRMMVVTMPPGDRGVESGASA